MAWDETSKKVAIKAIGTVESSMKYDSINYNDPITVGIAQWYGPRAADIIKKMGAAHATEFAGVAASLRSDLSSHGNDDWRTNRSLPRAGGEGKDEGESYTLFRTLPFKQETKQSIINQ